MECRQCRLATGLAASTSGRQQPHCIAGQPAVQPHRQRWRPWQRVGSERERRRGQRSGIMHHAAAVGPRRARVRHTQSRYELGAGAKRKLPASMR